MNQGRLLGHKAVKDYEGTREGDLGNDDACECERSQILPGTRYYRRFRNDLGPLDLLLNKGSHLRGALKEKFTSAPFQLINGVLYRMGSEYSVCVFGISL